MRDASPGPAYPAEPFLQRLTAAGSDLGGQLGRCLDQPLRRYLAGLVPRAGTGHAGHLGRLATALVRWLGERGVTDPDGVADHLLRVPVIQQADHANLLLDRETFLNNYLFHLACSHAGARVMVVSQCSTVSCLSRRVPVTGPVFLRTRGSLYRVFPFSKRRYKDSTFCCLPPPLTMTLERLEGDGPAAADDPVLGSLVGRVWPDPAEAYRRCNEEIWSSLALDHSVRRVAVDESLAAECAADHLLDPASPLRHVVFDPRVRRAFLGVKRELVARPDNLAVNRAAPDFFWVRRGSRLHPVVLREEGGTAVMVVETDGAAVPVPFAPRPVAAALRAGVLHTDRVLAYLVRCLLPGVVAVGGTSQQDYVRLYVRLLTETHRRVPFLDAAEVATVTTPGLSRLGGMPLLHLDHPATLPLTHLSPTTDLAAVARQVLDQRVGHTIGTLSCARYFDEALARSEAVEAHA
ncbi:hypothetical protein AQ490_11315 [Wenjunlia vitaminophila]|uniref:Uncharacterized protein n=1 Tax=Wenjunlia vitaminophila TaxID=76728 RepID=A0A0T6LK72_WENVI|nr:hypothetical protein [Wenjunlia vitaminophila]KRV46480.1 hypothetical protein AQ490_11315 [Wenjunlia vitaminophila]